MGIKKQRGILGIASIVTAVLLGAPLVSAATTANSQLTQTINAGVLSTQILDSSNNPVASPSLSLTAAAVQTSGVATTTGTFDTNGYRISVDNPGAGGTGGAVWTLSLAGSGSWTSGGNTYPFNAATSAAGQLTIDPSGGTITANVGGATGVTKGAKASFSNTVSSITLMTASSSAATMWNGYLTGVNVSQTIPAGTPAGSYTLNLTQTVTAS